MLQLFDSQPPEIDDDTVFGKRAVDALLKFPDSSGTMQPLNPQTGLMALRNRPSAASRSPRRDPDNDRPAWDAREIPPDSISDVDTVGNRFSPWQPLQPFGPPTILDAREWDYPVGFNLQIVNQRQNLYAMLRALVKGSGIIATVMESRIDEMVGLPWKFSVKDPSGKGKKSDNDPRIKELTKFFERPDLKKPYAMWMRMIFRDRYTLDAATAYIWKNKLGNKPYAIEAVDGATIIPRIDDKGRIPDWPNIAYTQVIKGVPMDNFTEREILYMPARPRTDLPILGWPEVEQIGMEAMQVVRKAVYMLNFWEKGSQPDVMIACPEGWSAEQIALWQATFDALHSGNLDTKSKMRFIPGGGKPFEMKGSAGELLKSEYDEWMARIVCHAFRTLPKPFVKEPQSRASAEQEKEQIEEQGIQSEMIWWKAFMDQLVFLGWSWDDIELVYNLDSAIAETDQATIDSQRIDHGTSTINEIRARNGQDPVEGGDVPLIKNGNSYMPLSVVAAQTALPAPAGGAGSKQGDSDGEEEAGKLAAAPFVKAHHRWSAY